MSKVFCLISRMFVRKLLMGQPLIHYKFICFRGSKEPSLPFMTRTIIRTLIRVNSSVFHLVVDDIELFQTVR